VPENRNLCKFVEQNIINHYPMKAPLLLRIAAIIMLLYTAGHTMGYPWTPVPGEQTTAILAAMKGYQFDVMGSMRSYWDFYIGFGLAISGFMITITVMLWQIGSMAKRGVRGLRPIIMTLFIGFVINLVFDLQYFFIIPTVMAIAITILVGVAFFLTPTTVQKSDPVAV
jgi:hypothetical protein